MAQSMHVTFFGFAIPDELFFEYTASDKSLPAQTHRFGWAFIDSLVRAGASVSAVSCAPVRDIPYNPRLHFDSRTFEKPRITGQTVSFLNITAIKHVTRYISAGRIAKRLSRPDAVFVHGVNSSLLWAAMRHAKRHSAPLIVVLTDPPSLRTVYDGRLTALLKRADRRLIVESLRRSSGVIVLAERLAHEFAPGRPYLLMEGIAEGGCFAGEHVRPNLGSGLPRVVYAGGLHSSYGVGDLLEARRISKRPWMLQIYGRGPLEAEAAAAAAADERIQFCGSVPAGDLAAVYAEAALLVNPRRTDEEFTYYSFPSKLMEYMASGTPVMTTNLPTIPPDYSRHLFVSDDGPAALAESIDSALAMDETARDAMGLAAREFILSTRGVVQQGDRMRAFAEGLAHG